MKPRLILRKLFRRKERVYILPTKMGGYLNGLIFLMFLLSIGYSNNLLLIFTLFLFGLNLLWVVQTHFHLHCLKLDSFSIPDGHVGESIPLKIFWYGSPSSSLRWKMILEDDDDQVMIKNFEDTRQFSTGEFELPKRGAFKWKYLKVATSLPFGLYQVWVYFKLDHECIGYPKLLSGVKLPALISNHRDGEVPDEKRGDYDIRNLAPYQGEESRKISWKHYARSGEILVKEGENLISPIWRHTLSPPENREEKEKYLSELATVMVYCHHHQIPFLLETKSDKLGPDVRENHLHQCLKVLGLC